MTAPVSIAVSRQGRTLNDRDHLTGAPGKHVSSETNGIHSLLVR
jgi:hypothetical protein